MKKVLLIDDMPTIIEQAQQMMENEYELMHCEETDNAIGLIKEQKPDIVILDMYLKDEAAYKILKDMKAEKDIPDMPVLFTGCDVSVTALSKIFNLGVSDFVKKPFVENILFKKIEEQLKLSEIGYRYDK